MSPVKDLYAKNPLHMTPKTSAFVRKEKEPLPQYKTTSSEKKHRGRKTMLKRDKPPLMKEMHQQRLSCKLFYSCCPDPCIDTNSSYKKIKSKYLDYLTQKQESSKGISKPKVPKSLV